MENVENNINGIIISVDYKVELIGLLITLSDEKLNYKSIFNFNETNDKYIKELEKEFGYLKNNKIVKKFFYLKEKYWLHYDKPIELALSLNDDYEFKKESNFKFKDNDEIKEFCQELRIFHSQINFRKFYDNHRETYKKWIKSISPTYQNHKIITKIIEYCGEEYKNYKFYANLIPFETNGGYGILLENEVHNCLRARNTAEYNNIFHIENNLTYLSTSIHEYLHGIINPLTTKYNIFTYETEYLYDKENPIPGYENDVCMINETIIRALTIRIFNLLTGINNDEEDLTWNEQKGFKHIRDFYDKLLIYEKNREKFFNIDSFYTEISNSLIEKI